MRYFCWVYREKKTEELRYVQRPRRRSVDPVYTVKVGDDQVEVPAAAFYRTYEFVGHCASSKVYKAKNRSKS